MRSERATRLYAALASSPLRAPGLPATVSTLARALGVQVGTLSGFVTGAYVPGPRSAGRCSWERIAQALLVPLHALQDGDAACPACGRAADQAKQDEFALRVVILELQQVADRLGSLPMGAAVRAQVEQLRRIAESSYI